MPLLEVTPDDNKRWDKFVQEHPAATIYHSSAWKEVIERTFKRLHPFYVMSTDSSGNARGLLASFISRKSFGRTRIVSLPMSAYCDPLAVSDEAMLELIIRLKQEQECTTGKFVELHAINEYPFLEELNFQRLNSYVTHLLKLDRPLQELKKTFHKSSVQRRINQAMKANLQLHRGRDLDDMKAFFHLLTLNRKKIGLPPLPFSFLKNMWEVLHPGGMLTLLLTRYKNRFISGIILLKFKNTAYYEYAAANPAYLKLNPNHFLIWKALEIARAEGYQYFDFGRSGRDNMGLMKFKARWGAVEIPLHYYYFPQIQSITAERRDGTKFKLINMICRRLPVRALQFMGNTIYPHLI